MVPAISGLILQIIDTSPWSLPLPCRGFVENALFMQSRVDLRVLLLHLHDKVLVCSCHSPPSQCWGFFLKVLFCDIFNGEPANEYCPDCGSRSESNDVGSDSEDNEYKPRQSHLAASGKQRQGIDRDSWSPMACHAMNTSSRCETRAGLREVAQRPADPMEVQHV